VPARLYTPLGRPAPRSPREGSVQRALRALHPRKLGAGLGEETLHALARAPLLFARGALAGKGLFGLVAGLLG